MKRMTKKGARAVTADLDNIAQLVEKEHRILGIPPAIAMDFSRRCDMISDAIERKAGFDPEEIGVEKSGPHMQDSDEDYMVSQFSQQENRELREITEDDELGQQEEQTPSPGVQASFRGLVNALQRGNYNDSRVATALALATKVAEEGEEEEEEDEGLKTSGYNLFQ